MKFVHHICIQTNNYEKSLQFYKQVLGFELISEAPHFHQRHFNSWLKLGEFYIELQTGKAGESLRSYDVHSEGIVHLCLWVKDLAMEVERMRNLGVEFILKNGEEIYQVENGSLCKFKAPEGTIIELRNNRGI
jgi:glyoxylase I family protein